MKRLHLLTPLIACLIAATGLHADIAVAPESPAVILNPKLELGDEPSPLVLAAINFLLLGEEDAVFINNVGRGKAEAFDEFSEQSGANEEKIREEHREALKQARAILRGDVELPFATHLTLYRYNPANKCFITQSASRVNKLGWFKNPAFDTKHPQFRRVSGVNLLNADQLEALELPPAAARKLGEYFTSQQGNRRQLIVRFKFRITNDVPVPKIGLPVLSAYITEVNFVHNDESALDPEIAGSLRVHPYIRTNAEEQLVSALKNRLLGGDRTIMFLGGSACLYCRRDLRTNGMPIWIFDQPIVPWYIIGNKILFVTPEEEVLQSYTFEEGKLSIEGVPFRPVRFFHDKENNQFVFPETEAERFAP